MTPLAPSIVVSRRGLDTAWRTASTTLCSPFALPTPMCARPWFLIIVLTSAKSRFIIAGVEIKSAMPQIPWRRVSSATLSASIIEMSLGNASSNLSLGIITIVSTYFDRFAIPLFAFSSLLLPSKANGLVTTATVIQPASFAIRAITGAAPVPVPPPIPAAMKSKSTPLTASSMASLLSSAAFSPISGSEPAPSPFVSTSPICILFS